MEKQVIVFGNKQCHGKGMETVAPKGTGNQPKDTYTVSNAQQTLQPCTGTARQHQASHRPDRGTIGFYRLHFARQYSLNLAHPHADMVSVCSAQVSQAANYRQVACCPTVYMHSLYRHCFGMPQLPLSWHCDKPQHKKGILASQQRCLCIKEQGRHSTRHPHYNYGKQY